MIDGFDWFSHLAAWQVGKIYQKKGSAQMLIIYDLLLGS